MNLTPAETIAALAILIFVAVGYGVLGYVFGVVVTLARNCQ